MLFGLEVYHPHLIPLPSRERRMGSDSDLEFCNLKSAIGVLDS
jgi:hypothetical protein